jgi:hypothetical protein
MDITLTRNPAQRKNPRLVIFNIEGRPGSVQFFRALFPLNAVPERLTLIGEFAAPKVKETPEERKARLAAMPKMTPAERLAKMEASVAKMKARLQAAAAPTPAPNAIAANEGITSKAAAPTAPHTRAAKGKK